MKSLFLMLCVSCVSLCAQGLLSSPRFYSAPNTVTYYQLMHRPKPHVRKLLRLASEKMCRRDFEGAISSLRSALAIDRKSWDAHLNLGAVYFWKGDRKSAQVEFESAASLDPANPLSYANLAVCELSAGEDESAVLLARQALQLDPRNALALRVLAAEDQPRAKQTMQDQIGK